MARKRRASDRYHTQIETILREKGPLVAYDIRQAMVGRWKNIPTPNQLGNLLSRNKNIVSLGEGYKKSFSSMIRGSGGNGGVSLWALIEPGE